MTHAEQEADRLFSLVVRAVGSCRRCGSGVDLQCAHIVTRSRKVTRWDESNALPLCGYCHAYYTDHPAAWEAWVRSTIGDERYDALVAFSRQVFVRVDVDETLLRLRRRARELEVLV